MSLDAYFIKIYDFLWKGAGAGKGGRGRGQGREAGGGRSTGAVNLKNLRSKSFLN